MKTAKFIVNGKTYMNVPIDHKEMKVCVDVPLVTLIFEENDYTIGIPNLDIKRAQIKEALRAVFPDDIKIDVDFYNAGELVADEERVYLDPEFQHPQSAFLKQLRDLREEFEQEMDDLRQAMESWKNITIPVDNGNSNKR